LIVVIGILTIHLKSFNVEVGGTPFPVRSGDDNESENWESRVDCARHMPKSLDRFAQGGFELKRGAAQP
jgi:hypothetical protein